MQRSLPAKNVEDYLKQFPEAQRHTLEKVRKAIKEAAPNAEEVISYGMPGYRFNGVLVYFAGFKNHCSFFPGSYAVMKAFKEELEAYEISKGTVRFPTDKPLSSLLIKKMVKAKIKENEAKLEAKKKKRAPLKTG